MVDVEQQPLQGTTKLHGFVRGQLDGVSVDAVEGQIHNEMGTTATLGNTPKKRHANAAEVPEAGETIEFTDGGVGQYRPEALAGKISHLVTNKVNVVMCGGVRAALESSIKVGVGPAHGTGNDWHSIIPEQSEEAGGRMGKVFEAGGKVTLAPGGGNNVGSPGGGGLQMVHRRGHELTYKESSPNL
jgi:hypothetical protein